MSFYDHLPKSVLSMKVGEEVCSMERYGCGLAPIKVDADFPYRMDILFDKVQNTSFSEKANDPHEVLSGLLLRKGCSKRNGFLWPKSLAVVSIIPGAGIMAAYSYDGSEYGLCVLSDKD